MPDTTNQIREKIDIVEFIRRYISLSPAGRNFKAACPFHKEKTPSFIISPEKQIWHCFGCNSGGDVIAFLMRFENLEFFEALKILAEEAGIELKNAASQDQKALEVLYEINSIARDFFVSILNEEILKYLINERGLQKETVGEFGIGVSSKDDDALFRYLLKKGFATNDIERAGLIIKGKYGNRYFDRFRNRIMFPLYNSFGKVVGFTARILPNNDDGLGKYVNSPETQIFSKSKILFGFHKSKNYIRECRSAVVMEGQMDFLMSWQAGVKNAVATSGTALTIDHVKLLKRISDQLILSFDQDDAGQNAIDRVAALAAPMDFDIKVLKILHPELKDPADVVRFDAGLLLRYLNESRHLAEHYFDYFLGHDLNNPAVLKKGVREVLIRINNFGPIEKQYWIKKLAERVGIDEHILLEELERAQRLDNVRESVGSEEPRQEEYSFALKDLIVHQIIYLAMYCEGLKDEIINAKQYLSENYQRLIDCVCGKQPLPNDLNGLYNFVLLKSSLYQVPNDPKKTLCSLIKRLRIEGLKEEMGRLQCKVTEFERLGKEDDLGVALAEFDKITKEMQNL